MSSPTPPTLESLAKRFPEVLNQMAAAAAKDATAEAQARAFAAACELMTQLVAALEASRGVDLAALEATLRTFAVSVPAGEIEAFLDKEGAVLRAIGLSDKQVAMALRALREAADEGALREVRLDAQRVLEGLRVLRDTCCRAQAVAGRGWRVSEETVEQGWLALFDACIVAGDLVSIPVGAAAGPLGLLGASLLAVGSVGSGVHSLFKRLDRLRGRLKQDEDAEAAHRANVAAMKTVRDAGPPERFKLKGKDKEG
jgi:hypothetical protein